MNDQQERKALPPLPAIDDYLPTDGPRWTTANFIACVERYATDYARAALAAKAVPAGFVLVNAGALQMVRNALTRDAEEGKKARGEMLAELDAATKAGPAQEPEDVIDELGKHDAARRLAERLGYSWVGGEWVAPAPEATTAPLPEVMSFTELDKLLADSGFEKTFDSRESAPEATPAQAQQAGFDAWWEREGQFCRAGGGDYEKSFAWSAWHAATKAATPAPAPEATPAQAQQAKPLTDEFLSKLLVKEVREDWHCLELPRAVEAACAEAWGVKLAGQGKEASK